MAHETRSERVPVALSPSEVKAIAKAAEKAGMTAAQYMRAATLTTMALQADPTALGALLTAMAQVAKEYIQPLAVHRLKGTAS